MTFNVKTLVAAVTTVGLAGLVCLSFESEAPKPLTKHVQPNESALPSPPATEEGPAAPKVESTSRVVPRPPPQPVLSAEDSLAELMHQLVTTNPAAAIELARQGQTRWPNGPRAAEFAATEVKCLYLLGKPSEGRGAAEAMVNKYRNSPWALEVERETGAHPYVNH